MTSIGIPHPEVKQDGMEQQSLMVKEISHIYEGRRDWIEQGVLLPCSQVTDSVRLSAGDVSGHVDPYLSLEGVAEPPWGSKRP